MRLTIKMPLSPRRFGVLVCRILLVAAPVFVSSYCTHPDRQKTNATLTADESYLVDAYARIARARDIRSVTYAKSESLFTLLDSTLDSTRIAMTIDHLNRDPDRWLLVFRSIERELVAPPQGGNQKRPGEDPVQRLRSMRTTNAISKISRTKPAWVRISRSLRFMRRFVTPS